MALECTGSCKPRSGASAACQLGWHSVQRPFSLCRQLATLAAAAAGLGGRPALCFVAGPVPLLALGGALRRWGGMRVQVSSCAGSVGNLLPCTAHSTAGMRCTQTAALQPAIMNPKASRQQLALTYWARLHAEHLRRPTATAPQPLQVGARLEMCICM